MERLVIIVIILSFFLACEKSNPVSEYGNTMIDSYKRGQQTGEAGNLDAVRRAVKEYQATNERYPQNLEEIKGLLRTDIDTSKYNYDHQTGTVSLKNN
jgi:cytochrome c556